MFPKRYVKIAHPDYPDLVIEVLANPTGSLFAQYFEEGDKVAPALVEAYKGAAVEAYGVTFDFSTPEATLATLNHTDVPTDLRGWLRDAPVEIVTYERGQIGKNFRASLVRGNS